VHPKSGGTEPHVVPVPRLLKINPTWEGVHLSDIVRSVQNRSSLELHGFRSVTLSFSLKRAYRDLRDCIEGLVEEGYIFNTIDEEHYSCA